MVNTKQPDLREKDAISEVCSKSDGDDMEFAVPTVAARQVSKFEPKEVSKEK